MIYIFTGEGYKNKKIIQERFFSFLKLERRNWRRSVFLITDSTFDITDENRLNDKIYTIVDYINDNENDILLCLSHNVDELLRKLHSKDYIEIIFSDEKIENKEDDCIYVNVSKYSVDNQYSKLITKLNNFS